MVRIIDCHDMTSAVFHGCKATNQINSNRLKGVYKGADHFQIHVTVNVPQI